jgi:hypothetical protein
LSHAGFLPGVGRLSGWITGSECSMGSRSVRANCVIMPHGPSASGRARRVVRGRRLFDHLVRTAERRRWDREAESLRGRRVDEQRIWPAARPGDRRLWLLARPCPRSTRRAAMTRTGSPHTLRGRHPRLAPASSPSWAAGSPPPARSLGRARRRVRFARASRSPRRKVAKFFTTCRSPGSATVRIPSRGIVLAGLRLAAGPREGKPQSQTDAGQAKDGLRSRSGEIAVRDDGPGRSPCPSRRSRGRLNSRRRRPRRELAPVSGRSAER